MSTPLSSAVRVRRWRWRGRRWVTWLPRMRPGLTAEEQAGCLRGLERVTSVATAARSSVLGAFTAGQGVLRRMRITVRGRG